MEKYGLLVDYLYCTGCHSCEIACSVEHGLPVGQFGIKVMEVGPWQIEGKKWQLEYFPIPTQQCDLCAERVAAGKLPSCMHNCQGDCIRFGTLSELNALAAGKSSQAIFIPAQ